MELSFDEKENRKFLMDVLKSLMQQIEKKIQERKEKLQATAKQQQQQRQQKKYKINVPADNDVKTSTSKHSKQSTSHDADKGHHIYHTMNCTLNDLSEAPFTTSHWEPLDYMQLQQWQPTLLKKLLTPVPLHPDIPQYTTTDNVNQSTTDTSDLSMNELKLDLNIDQAAIDDEMDIDNDSGGLSLVNIPDRYQPNVQKKKRKVGYLSRLRSKGGRKILIRRRAKGRKHLTHI